MLQENKKVFNALNLISDAIIIVIAMILAYIIRFHLLHGMVNQPLSYYIVAALFIAPFFLLLYGLFGLYESFRATGFQKELELIVKANMLGTVLIITCFFIIKDMNISRWTLIIFFFLATICVGGKRYLLRLSLRSYRARGYNKKFLLVVGSGDMANRCISAINGEQTLGFSIVGRVGDAAENDTTWLGGVDRLEDILNSMYMDEVIAALSLSEADQISHIVATCEKCGVKLSILPFYADLIQAHPYIDQVAGMPLINIRRVPLDNIANAFFKRTVDIVGSLILIALSSPLMLLAAIGTRLSSPGPIIFRQTRVGRYGHNFTMLKFRSMRINDVSDTAWSKDHDPRKTKFGALIRKCSIDELPQFFNVLRGDMSLIGPRPELPHFVAQFRESVPLYMVKHQVRPGITGWAQVNGLRGDTSIPERIRYDIYYIENWSLLFDMRILLLTIFGGMVNKENTK